MKMDYAPEAETITYETMTYEKSKKFRRLKLALAVLIPGAVLAALLTPAVVRAGEAANRSNCQNNLKQLGQALIHYANANHDVFPPFDLKTGTPLFPLDSLVPDYLSDASVFTCPSDEAAHNALKAIPKNSRDAAAYFNNDSYFYLGYAVTTEKQGLALIDELKRIVVAGTPPPDSFPVSPGFGTGESNVIRALKIGVERFLITDINCPAGSARAQSQVPMLIERTANHQPQGTNVLYMDGHVEFRKLSDNPGSFPATPKFLAALEELVKLHQSLAKQRPRPPATESVAAS
ncbi:MAG: DUF1559 domain-containing protein [Candidatus Hydrogenedentes bacterium]|nr:DUF1559 domain-containing protein [Candidatus Hydrogenedentota bacterium]